MRAELEIAHEEGMRAVAEGTNVDDLTDFRPGMKALEQLGIRGPLREVELGKEEIREASRELRLPTWDKPTLACLASRFPYGDRPTRVKLQRVAAAERVSWHPRVRQIRVHDYGQTARMELTAGASGRS